mgnify:CR=1 FL=1
MKIQIEIVMFKDIIDDVRAHHIDTNVEHDFDEDTGTGSRVFEVELREDSE